MSTVAAPVRAEPSAVAPPPQVRAPKRKWAPIILRSYTALGILYLVLPIGLMIMYSFNKTNAERVVLKWQGFTTEWYHPAALFSIGDLTQALLLSLEIAVLSTILAVVLGTPIALALVRYRYRGKGTTDAIMFLNIAAPEIVMGAALLSFFVTLNVPRGFATILISHVMFNIAFVVVTVRARMTGFDRAMEEAAQDLGAGPWTTFQKVTLPLIWPGILAGALLAFALSIDDFVITNFVSGTTNTFPIWVYGVIRNALPAQINVIGSAIFVTAVTFVALTTLRTGRVPR